MKLSTSASLLAIIPTLVATAPTFHPVGEDPNTPADPAPAPQPGGSQILAQLSSFSNNVGDFQGPFLRDKIAQALRSVCPNAAMRTCSPSESNITVPTFHQVGNYNPVNTLLSEDLHAKVISAPGMDGQRETYNMLIDAVAGIAGLRSAFASSCKFVSTDKGSFAFCNTFDGVSGSFLGAHMDVRSECTSKMGGFDCWQDRADVEEVLKTLYPRIGVVVGDGLGLFVASECGN
jgi:hypothetical protein